MNDTAIRRRQDWKEKIENWQSSGKTITAWCKENNIPYNTFQNWRRKLGCTSNKNKVILSPFIELQEENSSRSGVQLYIKGVSLHLSTKFDEAALSRCLRVLRGL